MENLGDGGEPDRGIVPIYALADGVSQFVVRSTVRNWFAANHELPEILPVDHLLRKTVNSLYTEPLVPHLVPF